MTTSTLTLASFLLARIEDDEAVARSAQELLDADPQASDDTGADLFVGEAGGDAIVGADPARVLAECAAKRAIISTVKMTMVRGTNGCGPSVIRSLASVYADHPDFDPAWR